MMGPGNLRNFLLYYIVLLDLLHSCIMHYIHHISAVLVAEFTTLAELLCSDANAMRSYAL